MDEIWRLIPFALIALLPVPKCCFIVKRFCDIINLALCNRSSGVRELVIKMAKRYNLTRILAILGTILAWLPLAATIFFTLVRLIGGRAFMLDYLMPAELFPAAFVGGGLLLWAALRARSWRGLIACGLVGALVLLAATQALAVITGLASGETEPVGWPWALVTACLGGYTAALVAMGVGGVLLLRVLFKRERKTSN